MTLRRSNPPQSSAISGISAYTSFMARILVVEDEPVVSTEIEKALRPLGYDIDQARDGKEALGLLSVDEYALIVTDLKMPERSGMDLVEMLRTTCSSVPVVVCSAFLTPEVREKLNPYGQIEYVTKPFKPEVLASTARNMIKLGADG